MNVKVRFAPSPTGLLHVGNIRIAILNYLFAKNQNGKFVLRIDDTDKERSTIESENLILEDLKWLGIEWDEFYKQSNHFPKYREAMEYLKSIGRIYPCYETKEELSLKRKIQASKGIPPVYDRASLKLSDQEKSRLESAGMQKYWRFKLNENESIEWNDLIHGKISISLNSISDPVVVKPDGSYVYTFASVVDDVNIGITHIIRGDDHVTNTAAQIDIFRALSGSNPEFAHVPLLSSIDGQDVSKRTSSSLSMVNLRNAGMEPQAIINVLSSLGTSDNVSHTDSLEDLVRKFSFSKMSLSSPKFNVRDVELLTRKIVSEKTFDEAKSDLSKIFGSENVAENISEDFWNTIKGNINTLKEVDFWYDIFYKDIPSCVEELDQDYLKQMLESLVPFIDFDEWISRLKKVSGRKGRDLFHPVRLVLTNQNTGPELRKIFAILGYEKIKNRIEKNIDRTK
ncbi:MAG: glutamate--tRNA ligase [Alphaproteobacteria bacterium]|nr:glutamate--tRNA ligase [Alphaproteobacteria bacterium]